MYQRNYHATVLGEEKNPKQKRKKFPLKTFLLSFVCVVIVGTFVTLTQLTRLQVTSIDVRGVNSADPKDVSEFVMDTLEGKWLFVFPKKSILLLPDHFLEKAIARAFPKFSDVSVSRGGTQTVVVSVKEYEGVYLWCESEQGECSFMDAQGVVFAPAPFFSGSAYIKIISGVKKEYPFIGTNNTDLESITFLLARLRAINIEPTSFRFSYAPSKLVVTFYHNTHNAEIIIDPTLSLETTLESFFTALRTQPFAGKFRGGVSRLQYIDLRLPHKVVYKFQ